MAKRKKSPTGSKRGVFYFVMRKIYVFIPLMIFLVAGLVLKTSIDKQNWAANDCCGVASFKELFEPDVKTAYFEGKQVAALNNTPSNKIKKNESVLGEATTNEKWVEVDLSEQKLIAHEGDTVFLESLVSTGLQGYNTPTGEFWVWSKIRSTKMSGGEGRSYYYLPNVPHVMFFYNESTPKMKGYSLHGAYWHNDFGKQKSHGCVNLPLPVAEKLYYWINPALDEKHTSIAASDLNPGARIIIHE
ncbi:MAG: hypothetical protein A3D24_00075 [Candidatus Blackburnbacteria bacterium RIFCSPHIGHO2_02_FULL_39_13]|uniref:L,D-TPase catalytic domain-containing protein n=1 Tax=Candidatus Blackburnbacteria bacterium RIFCSPLOWO2_01_FULL_40_20 TaxID=1797519 RepID=A0A1G1VET1_9BACT|nr:MAG: hypothetical protein UT38_C0016G0022 [Microgenomates group bacterium GW2011_GWA2_39_19]OGY07193.1 MAG: hypothetical protein A2694_01390 [Candidatus Blackburnbacteria bacterium RIFCSPHIGHO2_01_FULL_40_17]OGY08277.1 MAG: hypothetical protein A3D24_00075 [Candidatus Blackburnbacteria bacterium RIFCSPHIGHO2_02_FULL_39_13]OGY13935.1 MAG: hypothetical protein A3A77_04020 [Candidatus Blackburnbacteria bacterium RIFCSPLOWO2_01_FULL_40_20]HBL52106.1 hypothetical protein [Candidatus Blackburnbact